MIEKLTFRFGSNDTDTPLVFDPSAITVFVGPNNSGKSLILREIHNYFSDGLSNSKIISDIQLAKITIIEAQQLLKDREVTRSDDGRFKGHFIFMPGNNVSHANHGPPEHLLELLGQHPNQKNDGLRFIESLYIVQLDGKTRLSLTMDQPAGDLQSSPLNHSMAIFKDDGIRMKLSNIVYEAFGKYLVVDPTNVGFFRFRLSSRLPQTNSEEQSLDVVSRKFHSEAEHVNDLSDGVKAFVGLLSAALSSRFRTILVDEPEAFLHPPLTRLLARRLAEVQTAQLFVATDSADFIMGCIHSGRTVNIVRMTYDNRVATAKLLPSDKLKEWMLDPLLRSTGLLSGLFHKSVVVTEADSDRVFYAEINERLRERGAAHISDTLFINAQNKQTILRLIKPLRELGIPTAAIFDLDFIANKASFKDGLHAAGIPNGVIDSLTVLRANIEIGLKAANINVKKITDFNIDRGLAETIESLIDSLKKYGVFLVPVGEPERWLKNLDTHGHGSQWLMEIFIKMGSDPTDVNYVHASNDDVWKFVEDIGKWMNDPNRLGMK